MTTRTLILSGGGAYRDSWHPFAETSRRLGEILAGLGHWVEITEDVGERAADLGGWDLIVANAADGPRADTGPALTGLLTALDRGASVLAVHVGACTLLRLSMWESVTGAAWVSGRSGHPPAGPCRIMTYPARHVISEPVGDFDLVDERYAFLRTAPDIVPLAAHKHEGQVHPLLWARERGSSRIVTDLLGHDARSFDSAEHRELISRAARWATRTL
jgi:type 1 glutamine amidotransferase